MTRRKSETPVASDLRRRAEERVQKSAPYADALKHADRERLLHEMEVHQVELEMQNEELKRLKNEADRLAEKYLDIYDFAPIGYFTLNSQGEILQANLTGALMIGVPRAGLINKKLRRWVAPGSIRAFDALFQRAFLTETGNETGTCEFLREGKPPILVQIESRASVDMRECRLAMIDVTERKKAEEGRRRYELLALYTREIILFIDCTDGRIIEANAAAKVYGYTQEELRELTIRDLSVAAAGPAAARGNAETDDKGLFESLHRRRDGTVFPVEVSLHETNVGGRRILISIVRDITRRKQAETALEERTRQLENAIQELESFNYSVSHDLQAPLRAIDGYARMILKKQGERFDEETRARFEIIRKSSQKMGELITDLLKFSRLGSRGLSVETLDMKAIFRDAWKEQKTINPGRLMTLKIQRTPPAMGDRVLIREVVGNLLSNAVKFAKPGGKVIVEAGGHETGDETVYYVKDNGIGFNMTYYNKLFAMFQQLHDPDEYEGTGIGLAIAQRIVSRHGGRVWAEGEVDKGATFYFSLPVK